MALRIIEAGSLIDLIRHRRLGRARGGATCVLSATRRSPLDDGVERGEVVTCAECNAELEVIGLDPPRFVLAPPEEVDWGE